MKQILLVDDEQDLLSTLKEILEKKNYGVFTAINGRQALGTIVDESIDLVITDILMPEMEGLELIRKALEIDYKLPIVVMSGLSNVTYLTAAMHLGAVEKLTKPINVTELFKTVGKFLGGTTEV
ncbi:MAG: response regulator [bacterium]